MKIAVIIVRILLGAMFVVFSIAYFFDLIPQPPMPDGPLKNYMMGIMASGYLMSLIKITELICGLALVIGRFAPLATVVIFPVSVNILFTHALLEQTGLPVAIFIILANLFLAYAYRKNYETLVMAKPIG